jgi:hypothetical protein
MIKRGEHIMRVIEKRERVMTSNNQPMKCKQHTLGYRNRRWLLFAIAPKLYERRRQMGWIYYVLSLSTNNK